LYKIKETDFLFDCLRHLFVKDIKSNDEFNLTDALECMIQRGAKFKSFKVQNWFDCGKKETLLESNATLLKNSVEILTAIIILKIPLSYLL
jgi:glucose-1-phosphate thymidylyltransferase